MKMLLCAIPAISLVMTFASAAPTPVPFPSDEEIKKLPKEAIVATIKHQGRLLVDTLADNIRLKGLLMDASTSQSIALVATGGALSKLATLIEHDAEMTAERNKANAALNWYRLHWWGSWIALGLGVAACLLLAFLKFSGRLAMKL